MAKKCKQPGCPYDQFGGGYCRNHQYRRTDGKKPKAIRHFSLKRQAVNEKQYAPEARKFVAEHPFCAIRSPECTGKSECVNHKKGKDTIELLMDKRFWEASCFKCNNYCEDHDSWARENGHKISRHIKT